ncbi:glycosyltransferase family 2 protein [Novosphingobium huizhouense]|uniref:glycosyltransferase family 2 protein n=1 Tax=Novosphingobium huizhouense TaxID=2866625 RepID=UPI001CD8FFBB|nr:hypothetical protein [Novosphingobium huizhouense]
MSEAARTTVFCAVWHKDPDRHALLRAHRANLAAQTRPVEVIYVFDNGDDVPADLDARTIRLGEPVTIYEAWNFALAGVRTPFAMNLNLDDRLCSDAVAQMERAAEREQAMLVGGDWKICFAKAECDATGPCRPAIDLPFDPAWPPAPMPGRSVRLGSGSGDRGTFGPAVLWRMDVHLRLPRYPYRTAAGEPIRSVADTVFWSLVDQLQMKRTRLPLIVGHYLSHPAA